MTTANLNLDQLPPDLLLPLDHPPLGLLLPLDHPPLGLLQHLDHPALDRLHLDHPALDRLRLDHLGVDLLGLVPQAKKAVTTILARTLDLMWALALMEKFANSTHLSVLLLTVPMASFMLQTVVIMPSIKSVLRVLTVC